MLLVMGDQFHIDLAADPWIDWFFGFKFQNQSTKTLPGCFERQEDLIPAFSSRLRDRFGVEFIYINLRREETGVHLKLLDQQHSTFPPGGNMRQKVCDTLVTLAGKIMLLLVRRKPLELRR